MPFFCDKISWTNRHNPTGHQLRESVTNDGTDQRCMNQNDGNNWFSFKFRGPAVKYEIAIGILTGKIAWISKMYRGAVHDITIFRENLLHMLLADDEKAVADKGYRGEPATIDLPDEGSIEWQRQKARARARHETCNRRFKTWNAIGTQFRHNINFHQACFHAVATITELQIENGKPLFELGHVHGNI